MSNKKNEINESLLNGFRDIFEQDFKSPIDPRLVELTELKDIMGNEKYINIVPMLIAAYESTDPLTRRFGSILNAVVTQGITTFVITKALIDDLVKRDTHYQPNSCDTVSYKKLMRVLLGKGILRELRPPTRNLVGAPGNAGLYELVDKRFLVHIYPLIGEAVLNARRESFIKWYDENNTVKNKPVLSKEEEEELEKGRKMLKGKYE